MPTEQVNALVIALAAGFGLILAALVGLLTTRSGGLVRAAGVALVIGVSVATVVAWSGLQEGRTTALIIAAGLIPCVAAGTGWGRAAVGRATALVVRPAVRWAAVGVAGLALTVAGVIRFEAAEQAQIAEHTARIQQALGFDYQPKLGENVTAQSDRGGPIPVGVATTPRGAQESQEAEANFLKTSTFQLGVIRRGAADDRSNCHGWVFAAGRYHVAGGVVEQILRENGYVPVTAPRPGDLVVYRQNEKITHTAVVRYVTPGQPVMVEGKWGSIGVFLHAVDMSCYGTDYTYYRSSRNGHQLAGLNTDPAPRVVAGG